MKIKKTAQSAGVVATVVDNLESDSEIDALSAKQGKVLDDKIEDIKQKILWTNPNPNQAFNAQEITLNSSDYDVLEIFFKQTYSNNTIIVTKAIKGSNAVCMNHSVPETGFACNIERRNITYISDTKLSVEKCYSKRSNVTTERETYNDGLIPLYVLGHKTGLFS